MSYVIYLNDDVFCVVPDLHAVAVVLSMFDDTEFVSPDSEVLVVPISVNLCDLISDSSK